MSEVEDAARRQLKRHHIDLSLPRGNPITKVNGFANINGAFQENVEHNSEVLRNLLNLNHTKSAKAAVWRAGTEPRSPRTQSQPAENCKSASDTEQELATSGEESESRKDLAAAKLEFAADVPSESGGDSPAMPAAQMEMWDECNGSTNPLQETITESLKAKRARVENIITSMRHSPPAMSPQEPSGMDEGLRKPRRKQYQPQPQRWDSGDEDSPMKPSRKQEKTKLKGILTHLQTQLDTLQEKYLNMCEEDDGNLSDNSDDMDDLNEPIDTTSAIPKYEANGVSGNSSSLRSSSERKRRSDGSCVLDRNTSYIVRQTLKEELPPLLITAVDTVMNKLTKNTSSKHSSNNNNSTHTAKTDTSRSQLRSSVLAQHVSGGAGGSSPPPAPAQERKPTPPLPTLMHPSFFMRPFPSLMEQTEAISLVVPRKRVRNSDRPLHHQGGFHPGDMPMKPEPLLPVSLPTSVAIPNPSLHHTLAPSFMTPPMADPREHFDSFRYSPSPLIPSSHLSPLNSYLSDHRSSPGDLSHISGESPAYSMIKPEGRDTSPPHMHHERPSSADLSDYSPVNGTSITCTLTPTHLRKAKLMFFFTRYPSSALLRQHFPDVKFNRHNTSQIIKWFSNFREFYYIQMEKFARQAVSDGTESADDLKVTRDSELYRALNLHYNKSNEFTVPEGFLHVSTTTLREFFTAIKSVKDSEPSWKKTIYKVISKLDEPLPTFFKNPNCLDLLPL